jgi:hypothetical protein
MNMKTELEKLRGQIHKADIHAGNMRFAAMNDPGTGFSEELHKLTGELEALALQTRIFDEAHYTDGGILTQKPYNKHWDADISGRVEVDINGWLHITLKTLLPHCKYQTSPYLKDTLVRVLSNYPLSGGTLPQYQIAMMVIEEHCNIENRRVFDNDNKSWKAIPNALKGLVIADDDQFSLGVALISTWDRETACHIYVMNIEDAGAFFSFHTGDCGAYFR